MCAGQVLQVGTPFGQNKRVDNSSVQPQSPALEIPLLLLEERQQLLENLIPMRVDFPGERVTRPRRALPFHSMVCD